MKVDLKVITPASFARQVRFATSQALNDSAFAVRGDLVAGLADAFTIRNNFTERGFRVRRATKARPEAIVGNTRSYLADHVVGGARNRPALPTKKLRRSPRRTIRRPRWPRALISKARHFKLNPRDGHFPGGLGGRRGSRETLVLRRMGRAGRRLRLLWILPESPQRVRPRYPFEALAARGHGRTFPRAFRQRLKAALQTAR